MELEPDQEKVNFINEDGDNNEAAYNNFERIFFVLVLLIIGAFGLAISMPLFCLAQMRKLLLYIKRGKGRSHVTKGKVVLKALNFWRVDSLR